MAVKRRRYSEAFKRRAVAKMATGVEHRALAKKLGVFPSMLYQWRKRYATSERQGFGLALVKKEGGRVEWIKGAKPTKVVPLEALVLLRQAKKAWASGHDERAKYTALLALTTLEEK